MAARQCAESIANMPDPASASGRPATCQVTDAVGRVALPAAAPGFDSKWVLIGVPVALVVWLALVPLVFLLWQSFLTPQSAARAGAIYAGEFPLRLSQRR